jgi:hypothetical protein
MVDGRMTAVAPRRTSSLAVRAVAVVGAGALFGAAAFATFELLARRSGQRETEPSMRALVAKTVEGAPVRDRLELAAFLTALETRARAGGRVTALEVEPGMAAAVQQGENEQAAAFAERMAALSRELDGQGTEGREAEIAAAPIGATAADLGRISAATGAERQALIRGYVQAAVSLPENEASDRLAELNRLAGGPPAVDVAAVDGLRARIDAADGQVRGALIREWVELASALPEDERARRIEELDRRYGAPPP